MNTTEPREDLPERRHGGLSGTVRRSTVRWVLAGGLIAAAFPLLLGVYGLYLESADHAGLSPEAQRRCGMGLLAVLMVLFVGTPLCGLTGGLAGFVAARVCRRH